MSQLIIQCTVLSGVVKLSNLRCSTICDNVCLIMLKGYVKLTYIWTIHLNPLSYQPHSNFQPGAAMLTGSWVQLWLKVLVCDRSFSVNVITHTLVGLKCLTSCWSHTFPHHWGGMSNGSTSVSPHCWTNNIRPQPKSSLYQYLNITDGWPLNLWLLIAYFTCFSVWVVSSLFQR